MKPLTTIDIFATDGMRLGVLRNNETRQLINVRISTTPQMSASDPHGNGRGESVSLDKSDIVTLLTLLNQTLTGEDKE